MNNLVNNLDAQLTLHLFKILHPLQDPSLYSKSDNQTRLRLLSQTSKFNKMREEGIPEDLFLETEVKEQKKFEILKGKYSKVLKIVETKKLSSITKKFVTGNKHFKDLHFSLENFEILMKISESYYSRGQYIESIKIMHLLNLIFEEDIEDKLSFYWSKVTVYLTLVLSKGSTNLGMSGTRRSFRRDWENLWKQVRLQQSQLSSFDSQSQKQFNSLKLQLIHAQIVIDYVIKKKHLLGRNKDFEEESTLLKSKHKKSRKKSARKLTQNTQEPEEINVEERKESELIDIMNENDEKMGKCLSLIIKDLKLENFDWSKSDLRDTLGYLFILEVNIKQILKKKNMSNSQLVQGFKEIWFYIEHQKSQSNEEDKKDSLLFNFLDELLNNFDFEKAGQILMQIPKDVEKNWLFLNYKGEIFNNLLEIFMIVFSRVSNKLNEEILGPLLGMDLEGARETLKSTGLNDQNHIREKDEHTVDQKLETILANCEI